MSRVYLALALLLLTCDPSIAREDDVFVWPGSGVPSEQPVWGHRDGLRIGLAPAPGPHGLIRIYAPYLGQAYPRMVNFLSVEPTVMGQTGRDQSELELSRERPGERGLTFHASNHQDRPAPTGGLPSGNLSRSGRTLRLFVHPEPFPNGAKPVLEIVFEREHPHEIGLVIHAAPDSAPMATCVVSATMGNYGLLRRLHLNEGRIEEAPKIWGEEPLDPLGFLPWRTWSAEHLERTAAGGFQVRMSSDLTAPAQADYSLEVPPHWRYRGAGAVHFWRTGPGAHPTVAVNARRAYWQTSAPIPGGPAFENFELRMPFHPPQRLTFGINNQEP